MNTQLTPTEKRQDRILFPCIIGLVVAVACLLLTSCASFNPVKTEQGATITAHVADKVVKSGLVKVADKLDTVDNPYLHSVAKALRENSGDIISPADVQKIAVDYGDPQNKAKFKTLGLDLWATLKHAVVQYGKVKGTELVANGLNKATETIKKAQEGP